MTSKLAMGAYLAVMVLAFGALVHGAATDRTPTTINVRTVDSRADVSPTRTPPATTAPTTTTTAAPTTTTQAVRLVPAAPPQRAGDIWHELAMCETGDTMNPRAYNPAGPYYGFFQFALSTWRTLGGVGMPWDHPYEVQRAMAQRAVARWGWSQFPSCSRDIGAA